MAKKVLKVLCTLSAALFVVFGGATVWVVVRCFEQPSANIIGGAGAPTLAFLLGKVARSPVCGLAIVSMAVFIGTGLALIRRKKEN